jgi:hypothetical protein
MQNDVQRRLSALLSQAGSAHGEYETRELNGVYDQNWPDWYATFLVQHGLADLLGQPMYVDQVSQLLSACDESYRNQQPGIEWPDFYSVEILRRLHAA